MAMQIRPLITKIRQQPMPAPTKPKKVPPKLIGQVPAANTDADNEEAMLAKKKEMQAAEAQLRQQQAIKNAVKNRTKPLYE